jgi:hypothetical protein
LDLAAVLRRHGTTTSATLKSSAPGELPDDALTWSWPPYAPVETDHQPFDTVEWAPSSVVWHPQVRVGRWTVVYRRA